MPSAIPITVSDVGIFFANIFGGVKNLFGFSASSTPSSPESPERNLARRLQLEIYRLLSDIDFLNWITHLKTGGSSGVPVEKDTFRTVVLHKAYERLGMIPARPYGEHDFHLWNQDYLTYNLLSPNASYFVYPGEDHLTNEDTTNGFERDRPNIWHQITTWVESNIQCVAGVAAGAVTTVASGGTLTAAGVAIGVSACAIHKPH
jgi:hypothetical protein